MSEEPKEILDPYERETVAYFHALLPDEHDREYLSDKEIVAMWKGHSRAMLASWLVHDGLSRDIAMGMLRGWSASLYKVNQEIKALRAKREHVSSQLWDAEMQIAALRAHLEDA